MSFLCKGQRYFRCSVSILWNCFWQFVQRKYLQCIVNFANHWLQTSFVVKLMRWRRLNRSINNCSCTCNLYVFLHLHTIRNIYFVIVSSSEKLSFCIINVCEKWIHRIKINANCSHGYDYRRLFWVICKQRNPTNFYYYFCHNYRRLFLVIYKRRNLDNFNYYLYNVIFCVRLIVSWIWKN